ncbi:class I SAM-dependent methyltransferase [Bythopirellula polymerisocia]|uniref:Bifunctional 3-demethylubiquinone-9 3-methyltransferase/ 2-octaprenyl-6-hydroxy phenol methylase n=1 Tax=Bythopirellula polymerisocia TaxID=2528003 RepID=A0A5C6CR25_9BACT|nr:methyltransferase domain-containing protein [Bythopirellula polymerisocia]TWU25881.1 bifunctional 3-demethylubiquinone-9 3-methyltransferase/ 2-octaprenyl-6-hydroxy phenol methylase [Bythopirellula polymerisocia]
MNTQAIVDPLIPPLQDNQFIIALIAEISDAPIEQVADRFIQEHGDLGGNVRRAMVKQGIPYHEWSPDLEQFYATTDAFLYETLVWNRADLKNDMRRWIGRYLSYSSSEPQRVLTFGDGLGIDAYYLAQLGHEVTYFDVSQQCAKFARRIFEHGNLNVTMIDNVEQIQQESYDAVLCLDVLEHVPNPSELVGWLSSAIRDAGKLIVHAPFHYIHSAVTTHLRSNRRYSGDFHTLYEPYGLYPVDGKLFWNPLVFEKSETARSRRIPLQLNIGRMLLGIGRNWSTPHNLVTKLLLNSKDLTAMVK